MTEAEWLACEEPKRMLEYLWGKAGDRKLRLFAVACCRLLPALLAARDVPALLRVAELLADGLVPFADTEAVRTPPDDWTYEWTYAIRVLDDAAWVAAAGVAKSSHTYASYRAVSDWIGPSSEFLKVGLQAEVIARREQTMLLRDIFGNPFRPVSLNPAWLMSTVKALATQMYESRDFGAMPILADALQDAGCDNDDVLTHCRESGPHVRGCWVVDLLLGKA
jgi:hypothetical protein